MKMVIIIRKDLQMRKGKMIAQGSHASDSAISNSREIDLEEWREEHFSKKIVVYVNSEDELISLFKDASNQNNLNVSKLIIDEGFTEFNGVKTATSFAIGPNIDEFVDKISKNLKLL